MKFDRTVMVVVAVTFVIGLIAGFAIWGMKKEKKVEVKQLLNTAIQEIDRIEKENKGLKRQVAKTGTDRETAARLSGENKALKEQLQKAGQYKDETGRIRASLAEAEKRAQKAENLKVMKDSLQQRLLELEEENHNLRSALEKIGSITQESGPVVPESKTEEKPAVPGY
ncbi:MAG TPA: hypothetical protein ENH31_00605 [Nitrospirae bacterium]|nr:hypothetical protein BMS3Abin10_02561 [bacterium BMS3Abin10]GBE38265.1 hypothetical protein BMS3Bbin08_00868 [bacterium BMS3Bbin08]HDH50386.1 hypothetical protein [Nitrospirota bacterium]HDK81053.1 hypothetical protein [Nitrospirota bacterium]